MRRSISRALSVHETREGICQSWLWLRGMMVEGRRLYLNGRIMTFMTHHSPPILGRCLIRKNLFIFQFIISMTLIFIVYLLVPSLSFRGNWSEMASRVRTATSPPHGWWDPRRLSCIRPHRLTSLLVHHHPQRRRTARCICISCPGIVSST